MSARYLGSWFDIHCGGEDHIAVHHSNEIAQSQAAHGTRLANFWMHGHFLMLDQDRMSKSAGGFLRLQTLIERGIDPLAYRYLCLTAHYRSKLRFSWDALDAAQSALDRLRRVYAEWLRDEDISSGFNAGSAAADADYLARFSAEIDQDLNLPRALAVLWDLVRSDLPGSVKRATVDRFDRVLGLRLAYRHDAAPEVPAEIAALAEQRRCARIAKQWAQADHLRDRLAALGWRIEDDPKGQRILPIEAQRDLQ